MANISQSHIRKRHQAIAGWKNDMCHCNFDSAAHLPLRWRKSDRLCGGCTRCSRSSRQGKGMTWEDSTQIPICWVEMQIPKYEHTQEDQEEPSQKYKKLLGTSRHVSVRPSPSGSDSGSSANGIQSGTPVWMVPQHRAGNCASKALANHKSWGFTEGSVFSPVDRWMLIVISRENAWKWWAFLLVSYFQTNSFCNGFRLCRFERCKETIPHEQNEVSFMSDATSKLSQLFLKA